MYRIKILLLVSLIFFYKEEGWGRVNLLNGILTKLEYIPNLQIARKQINLLYR